MEKHRRDISLITKKISVLNQLRTGYIFNLVHGKPMVHGSSHDVFRRCGKKNCRCAEGKLHGPFPALSVNKNGKKKIVMIKKSDGPLILKESKRYRYFQNTLSKIRRINKEIDLLLSEVKIKTIRDYP